MCIVDSIRKDDFLITEDELGPVDLILEQGAVPVIDSIDIKLSVDKPVKIRRFRYLRSLRFFTRLFKGLCNGFFNNRLFNRFFDNIGSCLYYRLLDGFRLTDFRSGEMSTIPSPAG